MSGKLKILAVKDHTKMGMLIDDIARGKIAKPDTVSELNALLIKNKIVDKPTQEQIDNNIEPHWPNGRPAEEKIKYIEIPTEQMMIIMPSPEAIDEGRLLAEQLSTDGSYPFDKGYDTNYVAPNRKPSLTDDQWNVLYRTRLGDYTVGKCM